MARVLVVDDEPAIRQILSGALADAGHEVWTAEDGGVALSDAHWWRPDVIVLDLLLPGLNGWQFAEAYQAESGPHAPIVAITAAGPGAIRAAQGNQAFASIIPKPLQLDQMVALVGDLADEPSTPRASRQRRVDEPNDSERGSAPS